MYKVKLMPSECPKEDSWIKKHREEEIYDISELQYNLHIKHGCMEKIEHYRWITVAKPVCPTCGKTSVEKERIILNW